MHVSSIIFSTIYFPYMLFCIKNNSFDLEFDETFDEIVEKEIELLKWVGEKSQWNLMVHV